MKRQLSVALVIFSTCAFAWSATAQSEAKPVRLVLRYLPFARMTPLEMGEDGSVRGGDTYYEYTDDEPFFVYHDGDEQPLLAAAEITKDGKVQYRYRSPEPFEATTEPISSAQRAKEVAEFLEMLNDRGDLRCMRAVFIQQYLPMIVVDKREVDLGNGLKTLEYQFHYEVSSDENFIAYVDGETIPRFAKARVVDGKVEYHFESEKSFDAMSGPRP